MRECEQPQRNQIDQARRPIPAIMSRNASLSTRPQSPQRPSLSCLMSQRHVHMCICAALQLAVLVRYGHILRTLQHRHVYFLSQMWQAEGPEEGVAVLFDCLSMLALVPPLHVQLATDSWQCCNRSKANLPQPSPCYPCACACMCKRSCLDGKDVRTCAPLSLW